MRAEGREKVQNEEGEGREQRSCCALLAKATGTMNAWVTLPSCGVGMPALSTAPQVMAIAVCFVVAYSRVRPSQAKGSLLLFLVGGWVVTVSGGHSAPSPPPE